MDKIEYNQYAGYHRRTDGAMCITPESSSVCNICGAKTTVLFGLERNYPQDPDIFVCWDCRTEIDQGLKGLDIEGLIKHETD